MGGRVIWPGGVGVAGCDMRISMKNIPLGFGRINILGKCSSPEQKFVLTLSSCV